MGLGEHELEGWEGPTQDEVSRDVAVEVCVGSHAYIITNAENCRQNDLVLEGILRLLDCRY